MLVFSFTSQSLSRLNCSSTSYEYAIHTIRTQYSMFFLTLFNTRCSYVWAVNCLFIFFPFFGVCEYVVWTCKSLHVFIKYVKSDWDTNNDKKNIKWATERERVLLTSVYIYIYIFINKRLWQTAAEYFPQIIMYSWQCDSYHYQLELRKMNEACLYTCIHLYIYMSTTVELLACHTKTICFGHDQFNERHQSKS